MPESGEAVTRRGTVNDDYYATGGTVDFNAVFSGDVVVAGGELFIGHHIKGDVIAAGNITIDANIGDDLIASSRRLLSVSIVIILLGLLQLIPVIGGLFIFALLLLGLGAVIMHLKNSYSQSG